MKNTIYFNRNPNGHTGIHATELRVRRITGDEPFLIFETGHDGIFGDGKDRYVALNDVQVAKLQAQLRAWREALAVAPTDWVEDREDA